MKTKRQQEIIDVALDLINEHGIQGFTIKNLSGKIGVTEPAIYRHFENKIEILVAILDIFHESIGVMFENELQQKASAIEKIEHLFSSHFARFAKNPSLVSVIFSDEIFKGEPELIGKIYELINRNASILRQIISQGQQNGEIRKDISATHLSVIIMGSLRLFVKEWQLSGYKTNLNTEGKKLIASVVKLLV